MSARSELKALLESSEAVPDTWEIYDYPVGLSTLDDPDKPVAIVIEQRTFNSSRFSPDDRGIPLDVSLLVWVVVDARRGDSGSDTEDRLEAAAEILIRALEPLPETVWDGTATRDRYDDSLPAYQFPIRAQGALTPEE